MASDLTLYDGSGNPVILTGDEMKVHGIQSGHMEWTAGKTLHWTKFPDGTLNMWGDVDITTTTAGQWENYTIQLSAYPIPQFISGTVVASIDGPVSNIMSDVGGMFSTNKDVAIYLNGENILADQTVNWIILGRWK